MLSYRDLTGAYPRKRIGAIAKDASVWGLALLAAVMLPTFIVASAIRLVVRGFENGS